MKTRLQRLQDELGEMIEANGDCELSAQYAIALAITHVAEKLGELGFNNGSDTTPGIGEAISMALGYKPRG